MDECRYLSHLWGHQGKIPTQTQSLAMLQSSPSTAIHAEDRNGHGRLTSRYGQVAYRHVADRQQSQWYFLLGIASRPGNHSEVSVVHAPSNSTCNAGRADWWKPFWRSRSGRDFHWWQGTQYA